MNAHAADARAAVMALLRGETGTYGAYSVHDDPLRVPAKSVRASGAWCVSIYDGRLWVWIGFDDPADRHALSAVEHITGVEVMFPGTRPRRHRGAQQAEVLGPLGLAAIRASLSTDTTTVVEP